jgi:hypothetical protein
MGDRMKNLTFVRKVKRLRDGYGVIQIPAPILNALEGDKLQFVVEPNGRILLTEAKA